MEIVKTDLGTLLEPLEKEDRDYLLLVLMGMDSKEARKVSKKVGGSELRDLQELMEVRKEEYLPQALDLYIKDLGAKCQYVLSDLVTRAATGWDGLSKEDKVYAWDAIKMYKNLMLSRRRDADREVDFESYIQGKLKAKE